MTESQSVLVTGGASGIGLAIVERFLRAGANILMADINEQVGVRVRDELRGREPAGRVEFVRTDVAEEEDVREAVEAARRHFGRLDVVVNNAGIGGAFGPITELDMRDWDRTFAVIARGTLLGVKHGARVMREQGTPGAVVNIGSIAGLGGGGGPQAYSCAKAAVINLGRLAATELAPHQIRVNTVCPGVVLTPLVGMTPDHAQRALHGVQPWPSTGQPCDVANLVYFLASEDAQFVTGEVVTVDGGLTASGVRLPDELVGGNPGAHGMVGMSHGTSGEPPLIRRRGPGPEVTGQHHGG